MRALAVVTWLTLLAAVCLVAFLVVAALPASAHSGWCGHSGRHVHIGGSTVQYAGVAFTRTGHKHWVKVTNRGESYARTVTCDRHR